VESEKFKKEKRHAVWQRADGSDERAEFKVREAFVAAWSREEVRCGDSVLKANGAEQNREELRGSESGKYGEIADEESARTSLTLGSCSSAQDVANREPPP
jgi:hypothetical protein